MFNRKYIFNPGPAMLVYRGVLKIKAMVFGESLFLSMDFKGDVHTTHKNDWFWLPLILNSTKTSLQLLADPGSKKSISSTFASSLNCSSCVCVWSYLTSSTRSPIHMVPIKWVCVIPIAGFRSIITYQHIPLPLKVMVITNYARKSNLGDRLLETTTLPVKKKPFSQLPIIDLQGLWHVSFRETTFKICENSPPELFMFTLR